MEAGRRAIFALLPRHERDGPGKSERSLSVKRRCLLGQRTRVAFLFLVAVFSLFPFVCFCYFANNTLTARVRRYSLNFEWSLKVALWFAVLPRARLRRLWQIRVAISVFPSDLLDVEVVTYYYHRTFVCYIK